MFVTFKKSALLASVVVLGFLPFTAFGQETVDEEDVEIIFISHGPVAPQFLISLEFTPVTPTGKVEAIDVGLYGDFKIISLEETHGPKAVPLFFSLGGEQEVLKKVFPPGFFKLSIPANKGPSLEIDIANGTPIAEDDDLSFSVPEFPGVRFSETRSKMVNGEKELENGNAVPTERYYNLVTFENDTAEPISMLYIDRTGENYEVLENIDDSMAEEDGMICWWLEVPAGGKTTLKYAVEKWEVA